MRCDDLASVFGVEVFGLIFFDLSAPVLIYIHTDWNIQNFREDIFIMSTSGCRNLLYQMLALLTAFSTVWQFSHASYYDSGLHQRTRRQSAPRVFVVPQSLTGDLFNVSSWPPNLQEVYSFADPAPDSLSISPNGMVSLKTGSSLTINNITFSVNVTINGTSNRIVQVAMYVVDRGSDANIFANSPSPMWATCPVWIRPGTEIYRVQAIDTLYGAKVQYRLESGGEGKFDVDQDSGNVFIVGRWMFELKKIYTLAISAQIIGMVQSRTTPSQLLQVYVGALNPQFSVPVYNVSFYGNQSLVLKVQAESFQNLTLTYSMDSSDAVAKNLFRLNSFTGDITLHSVLNYRTSPHQYNFKLSVTEAYTNFFTATTLTLNLLPFNQPPVFLVSYFVKTDVLENIPVSSTILSVMAYDYDPGAYGQLNYTLTDDSFTVKEISNSEAQIIVAKPLDYDKTEGHRYEFSVIATDGGNLSSSATVQVWMKNINDEAPQFEPARQSVTVKEGAQAGLELMYIQAYDPDGDNISFNYDNPISRFSVDSKTGLLTLNEAIQPGTSTTTPSFNLTIRVTDDGSCCPGQGQGTIHPTVGYIEVVIFRVNTQPVFTQCRSYKASIDENVAANSSVLMLTATDRDVGDNGRVSFSSFSSENQNYFGVRTSAGDPKTAELYSGMMFDRENPPKDSLKINETINIPVTVKVQDDGSPPLSTNCILLVTINDVNDNSPVFDYTDYRITVLSNLQQNARVIRVFATDMDAAENAKILYSFNDNAAGDCRSNFAIDPDSGWISKTSSGVLTSATSGIVCNVVAADKGSPSRSTPTSVIINITSSSNNVFPSWQNYPGTSLPIDDYEGLYMLENDTMSSRVNLVASGPSGLGISYFLQGDPQLSNVDGTFSYSILNDSSLSIFKARPADASQRWIYYLRCRAFTSNNPVGVASIARLLVNIKDINDKTPYFIGMDSNGFYPASISIHTLPGDWVVNVTAIDMDREWPNNKISYDFDADCKDCSSSSDFTINPETGEIKAQTTSFRPNTDSTYTLGVVALDGVPGMDRNRGRAKVSIRFLGSSNISPKFDHNFTGTVPEGSVFNTTILNATIPVPQYEVLPQYGITTGNSGHRFAVDFKSGRVYVVGDIDYLVQKDYTLGYRVFDGTKIDTAVVSLTVSRSNFYPPVFNPAVYTSNGAFVEKDSGAIGSVIARVNATARDGSTITYSLVNPSDSFSVDRNTGAVAIKRNMSRDEPDGYATWQVNVMATDSSSNSNGYAVVNLVLKDINDHQPVFDTCCLWGNVPEKSTAGSTVFQLHSFDPDNGPNGTVTYSIPPDAPPSPFRIYPDGTVKLEGNLNYNTQNNYTLMVTATDGGGLTATKSINVFVVDANDNPPIFAPPKQYSVSIPEEMAIGSSVLTVQATDADFGAGAQLTYSVLSGQDSAFFYADSIFVAGSGVVKINQRIDFDSTKKSSYSFAVNARDPDPMHIDQASVVVTVYDINDNAPVFSESSMAISISESSAVNTFVAKFSAADIDSGKNAQFKYFIDYHYTDKLFNFQVDPTSGEVRIRNKLDFEVTNYFAVNILAIDEGDIPLTGTATLTVYVLDANDRPPMLQLIADDSRPFVPADATRDTRILHLKAADPDNSTNPAISFSYDSSCPYCSHFKIVKDSSDPNAAWIVADRDGYKRSDLPFSSYNLSITLSDGTNSATYPINLIVESRDYNPSSDGEKTVTVYNYARSSGAFGVLPLGNVYVTDLDDWDLQYKKFALVSQSGPFFRLRNGDQLEMYGNTTEGQYTAVVEVTDVNYPNVVAKGKVTVNVKFINDTAVQSAGTIRLSGIDATDLLTKDGSGVLKLQKLQQKIAELLNTKPEYVDVFSFSNVPGLNKMVDVVYSAHGSPFYTPEKMNALVWANRNKIYQDIQLNVTMAPVDMCQVEFQNCWDSGCTTYMNIGSSPGLVNTNQTSFVGLNTSFVQKCICPSSSNLLAPAVPTCEAYACYNSGTCVVNGTNIICICPVGFDGPRCQKTKISFSGGQSFLYLKPLESCETSRLSLDFQTTASDGLLLFNGPMTAADSAFVDFVAIQIRNGRLELRINLGDGNLLLPSTNVFLPINDGRWHTVEVFHEGLVIRMVLDYCSKASYDETLQNYTMNRTQCEVSGAVPREKFLLNVVTPLQLGGRSDASFNNDLIKTSFSGCIRNLQHNGELYDLAYSPIQTWSGVSECDRDQCSACPANASCVTDFSGNPLCLCPPGFGGDQCASSAVVKSFDQEGFANWTFSSTFSSKFNHTSALDASLQVMFRTRTYNGIILLGESFSTLERNILEVVNGILQFRYDLGNGDWNLSLPYVRVDDGVWHTARVVRHGNQVILRLDGGDDIYFNSTLPRDARRVLRISNLYGLGEVRMNPWSLAVTVKGNLVPSCLQDVRFMDQALPLEGSNAIASVTLKNAKNDCTSTACAGVSCVEGKICYDLWRSFECRCEDNTSVSNSSQGQCFPPIGCFAGLCGNGGTCVVINGLAACICPPQWRGMFCYENTPTEGQISSNRINMAAAIAIPIVLGCIVLLLLILLIAWCFARKRKPDYLLEYSDEDASRENVIAYDEEGAGEEDAQAYDLMRLQKPLDPDLDGIQRPYGLGTGLKSAAPDPLSRGRLPGDYPNIGEFINDRLNDADDDDNDQDSKHGYDYEGGNSQAGSLSTLGSSSSGDLDFGYLNDWGPRFKKLADLYGDEDDEENEPQGVSHV